MGLSSQSIYFCFSKRFYVTYVGGGVRGGKRTTATKILVSGLGALANVQNLSQGLECFSDAVQEMNATFSLAEFPMM